MVPRGTIPAMKILSIALTIFFCVGICTSSVQADTDYFKTADVKKDKFRVDNSRTSSERKALVTLFGASLLSAGVGLAFHLQSREITDELTATGSHTRRVYTPSLNDRRQKGLDAKGYATYAYAAAGVFLVSSIVVAYLTDPGSALVDADDGAQIKPQAPVLSLVPTTDGLILGGAFHF